MHQTTVFFLVLLAAKANIISSAKIPTTTTTTSTPDTDEIDQVTTKKINGIESINCENNKHPLTGFEFDFR